MSKNKSAKGAMLFLLGSAIGAGIGYVVTAIRVRNAIGEFSDEVHRIQEELESVVNKKESTDDEDDYCDGDCEHCPFGSDEDDGCEAGDNCLQTEKDVIQLVDHIMQITKNIQPALSNEFWEKVERNLLTAIIGAVYTEFPDFEKSLESVVKMLKMGETREDNAIIKNPVELWFEKLEAKNPEHFAITHYLNYKEVSGCMKVSIINECINRVLQYINLVGQVKEQPLLKKKDNQ